MSFYSALLAGCAAIALGVGTPEPPPPVEMTIAVLRGSNAWTSAASAATGSFTPPANSYCVVITTGRRDSDRTVLEPVSTHDMAGSWALLRFTEYNTGSGSRLYVAVHGRFFGTTPGAGTITGGWNGSVYQGTIAAMTIEGANATPLLRAGGANNASGTTLVMPYTDTDTPPTDMQGIVATISEGASTAMALAGYTLLATFDQAGPVSTRIWAKLASVANSVTVSDFTSAALRAGVNVGIAHG